MGLKYLVDYISAVFQFVIDFFVFLFNIIMAVINILGVCIVFIKDLVLNIPPIFTASVLGLIIICVIYKVIGREG